MVALPSPCLPRCRCPLLQERSKKHARDILYSGRVFCEVMPRLGILQYDKLSYNRTACPLKIGKDRCSPSHTAFSYRCTQKPSRPCGEMAQPLRIDVGRTHGGSPNFPKQVQRALAQAVALRLVRTATCSHVRRSKRSFAPVWSNGCARPEPFPTGAGRSFYTYNSSTIPCKRQGQGDNTCYIRLEAQRAPCLGGTHITVGVACGSKSPGG